MPWPKTHSLSIHSWINHTWHYRVKKTLKQKKSISLSYCFNQTILHQKVVLDTTRGCRSTQREDSGWVAISYTYFISKEVIVGNLAPLWIACNKWTVEMGGVFRRGRVERPWAKPIVPVWLKMEDACISFFWMVMESLWRKKITRTEIEVPSGSFVPSSDVGI